ncbi:MAG: geranylgeranyl reductase family protein [Syntrophobacteraceae bacterium]
MRTLTCDILVVGAGPAGSSAAREAASKGASVIVVERRAAVGVPVQCAEYIPAPLLGELGCGRGFVVQSVKGMRTFLNGRLLQQIAAPGYTIRRDVFDRTLADKAERSGAGILLSTSAFAGGDGEVMVREKGGALSRVRAKVIIGADGPRSKVAGWIDCTNRNLMPAVQARMTLEHPMEYTEIFLDDRIYGGYGWLFPKGSEANVGVGMRVRGKGCEIGRVLFDLLARLCSEGKISGRPLDIVSGWVPVEPAGAMRAGNILLAGDAAGHAHPITGAGIPQAVIGGNMAGKWAAHAVDRADWGKLAGYESEWREFFGETLEKASSRRRLLESKWDRLEEIVKYCWVTFKEYHSEYE